MAAALLLLAIGFRFSFSLSPPQKGTIDVARTDYETYSSVQVSWLPESDQNHVEYLFKYAKFENCSHHSYEDLLPLNIIPFTYRLPVPYVNLTIDRNARYAYWIAVMLNNVSGAWSRTFILERAGYAFNPKPNRSPLTVRCNDVRIPSVQDFGYLILSDENSPPLVYFSWRPAVTSEGDTYPSDTPFALKLECQCLTCLKDDYFDPFDMSRNVRGDFIDSASCFEADYFPSNGTFSCQLTSRYPKYLACPVFFSYSLTFDIRSCTSSDCPLY
jgi:hypothetical protein